MNYLFTVLLYTLSFSFNWQREDVFVSVFIFFNESYPIVHWFSLHISIFAAQLKDVRQETVNVIIFQRMLQTEFLNQFQLRSLVFVFGSDSWIQLLVFDEVSIHNSFVSMKATLYYIYSGQYSYKERSNDHCLFI